MKTIIAGSRSITRYSTIEAAIAASGFSITEVVSGCARGVDRLGEFWAANSGVPVKRFPADWERHGKGAGAVRNRLMGAYADAAVVVWDGSSKGSADMIIVARSNGLAVYVYTLGDIDR